MSFTITLVTNPVPSQNAVKNSTLIEDSLENKLVACIEKFQATNLFSEKQKAILEECKDKILRDYLPVFEKKEDTQSLPLALCDLLLYVIYPAALNPYHFNLELDELLNFEKSLKNLLELILPPGENVDRFINEYEQAMNVGFLFKKQLELIDECFIKQKENFLKSANTINNLLKQTHANHKEELLAINDERKQEMTTLYHQVDNLVKQSEQSARSLSDCSQAIQNLSVDLQKQQADSYQNNIQIQNMLRELKK